MVFDITHKAIIFSMGNISINWITMAKNASYDLGITRINLCTISDNKKIQITSQGYHMLWLCKNCGKVIA
jgi:hypothetical protein